MKPNKYDYYLFLIFISLIFGAYGGAFQPIRIITIFIFIYIAPSIYKELSKNKYPFIFLVGLSAYAGISTLFTLENFKESLISYIYFLINLALFSLIFVCYKKSNYNLKSIINGIYIFLSVSLSFSIYEIYSNKHLSVNLDHGVESLSNRSYSSFTFGNYNTYVMVLMMLLPILIYAIRNYSTIYKTIGLTLFGVMSYVVFTNGSRTGSFLVLLSAIILVLAKDNIFSKGFLIKILSLALGIYLVYHNQYIFDTFLLRLENSGLESGDRVDNLTLPFEGLVNSLFLGFGIGNYKYFMLENFSGKLIVAPHNFIGELFYELGIISVTLLFLLFLSMLRRLKNLDSHESRLWLNMLIFIPFLSIINSGYLLGVYIWIYLTLMLSISYTGIKKC